MNTRDADCILKPDKSIWLNNKFKQTWDVTEKKWEPSADEVGFVFGTASDDCSVKCEITYHKNDA